MFSNFSEIFNTLSNFYTLKTFRNHPEIVKKLLNQGLHLNWVIFWFNEILARYLRKRVEINKKKQWFQPPLTHKLSHISISEMPDSIKFQFICCCAALFECHAYNPKATRQRCICFRGEDPERTSKMSNNEEFYVKVKFVPRT